MHTIRWITPLFVLFLLLTACGSSNKSASSVSGIESDRIVVSELPFSVDGMSAFDLINRYRPHWLKKRGRMTLDEPVHIKVYVDQSGSAYGGIGSLRDIRANDIAFVKHYSPREAQYEFGSGNMAGAILVRTEPFGK